MQINKITSESAEGSDGRSLASSVGLFPPSKSSDGTLFVSSTSSVRSGSSDKLPHCVCKNNPKIEELAMFKILRELNCGWLIF